MSPDADRELDAKIARMMGWTICLDHWERGEEVIYQNFPRFSTTWEGMGLVVEWMQARGWEVRIYSFHNLDKWRAAFVTGDQWVFQDAPTAPQAVALAALAANGNYVQGQD